VTVGNEDEFMEYDCLLTGDCNLSEIYLQSSGDDFPLCGSPSGPCATLNYSLSLARNGVMTILLYFFFL
jgi:hypothetical protein